MYLSARTGQGATCKYSNGPLIALAGIFRFSPASNEWKAREQRAFTRARSWQDQRQYTTRRADVKLKNAIDVGNKDDIIIGDLSATLEAHRDTNRASIIRKLDPGDKSGPGAPKHFIRPSRIHNDQLDSPPSHGNCFVSEHPSRDVPLAQSGSPEVRQAKAGAEKNDETSAKAKNGTEQRKEYRSGPRSQANSSRDKTRTASEPPRPGTPRWVWEPKMPWLSYMETMDVVDSYRLTAEIKAFEAYMQLTPEEEKAAAQATLDVEAAIKRALGPQHVYRLGSRTTGLATPLSDIDFGIAPDDPKVVDRTQTAPMSHRLPEVKDMLVRTKSELTKPTFRRSELIPARVSIVQALHLTTGLKVQIQIWAENIKARELTKAYVREFKALRAIFTLIRFALQAKELHLVYHGYIGSFTLLMMIVTALKHTTRLFEPDDFGGQLLHVLDFWINADRERFGYTIEPPTVFERHQSPPADALETQDQQVAGVDFIRGRPHNKHSALCLQHPADYHNDLGANSYAADEVFDHLRYMRDEIRSRLGRMKGQDRIALRFGRTSLLPSMGNFALFERKRSQLAKAVNPVGKGSDYYRDRIMADEQAKRAYAYRDCHGMRPLRRDPQTQNPPGLREFIQGSNTRTLRVGASAE